MDNINRDRWLVRIVAVLLWIILFAQPSIAGEKWFRGQLHAHTYWSDGRGFPEQAAEVYKQRGYNFLCLTDHNRFAEDKEVWRDVEATEGSWPPKVSQEIFDSYLQSFGKDRVETRRNGSLTSVRLKTYEEVKAQFDDPGKFILLPGVELTQNLNKYAIHMNYINLPVILPVIKGAGLIQTVSEPREIDKLISMNASETEQAATQLHKKYLLILNHPFWVYCDIRPDNLINCPEIRFFEICNGGSDYAPYPSASTYTPEKFWDVVNAFRCIRGTPLLYGVASDDAHFYDAKRISVNGGVGDAWVMVRAAALTPDALLTAMHMGNFYASTGVLLDKIDFSTAKNTLSVNVKAEPGVKYRIHFITTKQGFDQQVKKVDIPADKGRPVRRVPIYSDEIGQTVKTVEGTRASYRLNADDLYVRARVESNRPSRITAYFHPTVTTAWTQPYPARSASMR